MAKKRKRKIKAPALSSMDRGIYYLLVACSVIAGMFLYPWIIGNFRSKVFQDTRILAQDNPSIILCGFGLLMGAGSALLLDWLRRKKQPIFGKRNLKYGPPEWKPIYPLFSKAFWHNACQQKKRMFGWITLFLLTVFTIFCVSFLGLYPRNCLYDNGSVRVYNCFNENSVSYDPVDVTQIRIFTREYYDRRGSDDFGVELEITMADGEDFFFHFDEFKRQDENIKGFLTGMHQIKNAFDPSLVTFEGKENLQKVIRDQNLNAQESELLWLLFDVHDPA